MKETELYKLDDYFEPEDLEWRIQQSDSKNGKVRARVLVYVTSRAVQNRFDSVCGKSGWASEIRKLDNSAYTCKLSVYVESVDKDGNVVRDSGRWVTKEDGADESNIEATKGGISGAIKRAAVQWGVGRYLYNFGESWADFKEDGKYTAKIDGTFYRWNPPALPSWAVPKNQKTHNQRIVSVAMDYLNSGTVEAKFADVANKYMSEGNFQGLEGFIDYCWAKEHTQKTA